MEASSSGAVRDGEPDLISLISSSSDTDLEKDNSDLLEKSDQIHPSGSLSLKDEEHVDLATSIDGRKDVEDAVQILPSGIVPTNVEEHINVAASDDVPKNIENSDQILTPGVVDEDEHIDLATSIDLQDVDKSDHILPPASLPSNKEEHIDLATSSDVHQAKSEQNQIIENENSLDQRDNLIERVEVKNHTLNPISSGIDSPKVEIGSIDLSKYDITKCIIDTTAPFESVKEAVSKFGGIVDWKAHRLQTVKRRKLIERELEKVEGEIIASKKQAEISETEKEAVLNDLDLTKRQIEELKVSLEQAEREEHQAKQDSELAKLRLEEIEQGITDESSIAAKAQLEVAKARHTTAISDLESAKSELEILHNEYTALISEKETAARRAEDAVRMSKEAEKKVEELTIELITTKEALESAHAARLEAEEQRIGAAMARDHDILTWDKEVNELNDEIRNLENQIELENELKEKYDVASSSLSSLREELQGYIESETDPGVKTEDFLEIIQNPDDRSHTDLQSAITLAKEELEKTKLEIDERSNDVSSLQDTISRLRSEIEKEKSAIISTKQREGMADIAVGSLEAELARLDREIDSIRTKEREARERMVDLPRRLQQAEIDADEAKSDARLSREDLRTATDRVERARDLLDIVQSKLHATGKEIEAARASEKLASEAVKALHGSEDGGGVVVSVEEYYELSKRAGEAEDRANMKVADALARIESAKESEGLVLKKLEEAGEELAAMRGDLDVAVGKAEEAKAGKLGVEQELRKWRAEHEQRRRSSEVESKNVGVEGQREEGKVDVEGKVPKKKRSFFPRILMFLARRKVQASKSS